MTDDWARYGGARHGGGQEADELLADDPFADYRREGGSVEAASDGRRPMRTRSNLVGAIVAVGMLAGGAIGVNLVAPSPPLPAITPRPYPTVPSIDLSFRPRPTLRMAHVAVVIPLPVSVFVPERSLSPDDGKTMFLAGSAGAFSIDVGAGRVGTVWGGASFPKGLRRLLFDQGLWVASWPSNFELCGPPCWEEATTYRIDPASGAVTATLARTYLVGASFDGVKVAGGGSLRVVDPTDAHEISATPWKSGGEPRLGCDSVWSVEGGDRVSVGLINDAGNRIGGSTLDPGLDFGPVNVEGFCWMMSGRDGASKGSTSLVWLNPNGSVAGKREYGGSLVVLNGEFWLLQNDATIQRFEAASTGLGYGFRYKLPVAPPQDDPALLFSSVNGVWLYSDSSLVGFDILTGSANQGG